MLNLITIIKALAEENRLRALYALNGRELCVCQIIELLGLSPSTVSKHMSILRQARLVESRKDGRWIYYRQAGNDAGPIVGEVLDWVCRSMDGDRTSEEDSRKLKNILKTDPEILCMRQLRN